MNFIELGFKFYSGRKGWSSMWKVILTVFNIFCGLLDLQRSSHNFRIMRNAYVVREEWGKNSINKRKRNRVVPIDYTVKSLPLSLSLPNSMDLNESTYERGRERWHEIYQIVPILNQLYVRSPIYRERAILCVAGVACFRSYVLPIVKQGLELKLLKVQDRNYILKWITTKTKHKITNLN